MRPADELRLLAEHYGVSAEPLLQRLGASLEHYAEWVLGEDSLAVVTLGEAPLLADLVGGTAAQRLVDAALRWPAARTGIKVDLAGKEAPTLYVRTLCPWSEGLHFLLAHQIPGSVLSPARTLYGLGFQGEMVKTYALTPQGFVSRRMEREMLHCERKDYEAEVPWAEISWPDAGWRAIGQLGTLLGFTTAGHIGVRSDTGERKVYVERVGGIPTDRTVA